VSAAAALAVLDILEQDKLMDQAKSVGNYLKSELEQALKEVECVKEIRGKGLFLGIELNEPSVAAETMENMMKEGVLVGKTGPKNNVIKLRPPMTFNSKHADFLVDKLTLCLEKTN
jgi:4-aminobutyrate aminotransferase-like enzyme